MSVPTGEPIQELVEEEAVFEVSPDDFKLCVMCGKALSADERLINARFVNEALATGNDISMFPVCIKCNFDNLILSQRVAKDRDRRYTNLISEEFKHVSSGKRQFENSVMKNSE